MLSVICFSKDRPLQLDALLDSLHFFSSIPFRQISVIYTFSAGITYDEVMSAYPDVVWVRETDFIADFKKCVVEAGEFIMLCCDDMVFKAPFAADTITRALKERPDALALNLKLGANLHSLPRLKVEGDLLSWNWRVARRGDWYFPWDLSGGVYRREFVDSVLDRYQDLSSPNRLEFFVAYQIHDDAAVTQNTLLCFRTSKCVVPTINRVQDEFRNDFDDRGAFNPVTLHAEYRNGKHLDWPAFALKHYRSSHVNGRDFRLVEGKPTAPPAESLRNAGSNGNSIGDSALARRIAFWNFATRIAGFIRLIVPGRILALARKF